MSDVDVIEEVMRQCGYPDYPNLSPQEEKEREILRKKLKEKIKDKEFESIDF